MSSNEEQVKKLHQKLNVLEAINPENSQKIKLTHIQELVHKISQESYQEDQLSTLKAKQIIDLIKKIESRLKDQADETEKLEEQSKVKIARALKIHQRAVEKMVKERKDAEKKINVALEGFLIELTSAKTKSNSACKYAVKQFSNLEMQLNALEAEIEAEENCTKDITKKIYAQFSSQIEELSEMLAEEKKEKEIQEQKILGRLEKMYGKAHQAIKQNTKHRQYNEQQIVSFVQKLIQKIQYELIHK